MPAPALSNPRRALLRAVLMMLLLVVGSAAPARAQSADGAGGGSTGTSLKAQYDEVLGDSAALEKAINSQARRMIDIGVQINDLQYQLAVANLQNVAATRRLARSAAADRAARRALQSAQRRMQRATDELHAQAVSAYIGGGPSGISVGMLLRSFDGSNASERASSYAGAVAEHQRAVVNEYRAAKAARRTASARATKAHGSASTFQAAIARSQLDLKVKRVRLEGLRIEAANAAFLQFAARSKLVSRKIAIEARITALDKASDGIGQLLASAQAREPDYVPGSITFTTPMPGVRPGSPFGLRFHPILRIIRLHAGIDFGAPSGSPIRAAADGLVLTAGDHGGYGNATVIDHGNSIATVYAHQSQIIVQAGQQVKAGDVIGAVGTTGLSTGPHLHFETRVRGVAVNPTSLIDFGAGPSGSGTAD